MPTTTHERCLDRTFVWASLRVFVGFGHCDYTGCCKCLAREWEVVMLCEKRTAGCPLSSQSETKLKVNRGLALALEGLPIMVSLYKSLQGHLFGGA